MIGLKNSYFPLIHLLSCYRTVCYRTVSISQSHSKLKLKLTNHISSCNLNQPIKTLVSITIETSVKLNWGFLQNREFFPLNNDYILEDSSDLFYPMAQMSMRTIQKSSFVDMLTCSDKVQPSIALFYIASQQPRQTEVNIYPTVNTTAQHASISSENPHFVQQNQNA